MLKLIRIPNSGEFLEEDAQAYVDGIEYGANRQFEADRKAIWDRISVGEVYFKGDVKKRTLYLFVTEEEYKQLKGGE